jgi:hypothetical protein
MPVLEVGVINPQNKKIFIRRSIMAKWDGAYPIALTSLLTAVENIQDLTHANELNDFDAQAISEKFTRVKTMLATTVQQVNDNQSVHETALTDLRDSVVDLGNDLKSKIDSVSSLAGTDLDEFKTKVEILSDINIDTISDLIRGQGALINYINGTAQSVELPQFGINSVANGVLVIDITPFGFSAGNKYTLSALADNSDVSVSIDRTNSDHEKVTLFLKDNRYDFKKGFDTTAQPISLDFLVTHNNTMTAKKPYLSNSVTIVGNVDNTDASDDTLEQNAATGIMMSTATGSTTTVGGDEGTAPLGG